LRAIARDFPQLLTPFAWVRNLPVTFAVSVHYQRKRTATFMPDRYDLG
jgi:hypothetical protein